MKIWCSYQQVINHFTLITTFLLMFLVYYKYFYLLNLYTDSTIHPSKPDYASLNSGRNNNKYSGLKKPLIQRVYVKRYQCEVCKIFKM